MAKAIISSIDCYGLYGWFVGINVSTATHNANSHVEKANMKELLKDLLEAGFSELTEIDSEDFLE